jgi:dolichyl-phosphate beta-glucosyltransferase
MQATDRPSGQSEPRTCLVVPCFNEAQRFDKAAFDRYLASESAAHFVLVNDGSTDDTLSVLEGVAQAHPTRVNVLDVQPNSGKAEAVRRGMQLAMADGKFEYVGYWDADLATPLEAIPQFTDILTRIPAIQIVLGTRVALLGRRIDRLASRHYFGRVFATAASLVLGLAVYDTQCGAKLFRVNDVTRGLFEEAFGSRWIFDVEVIARFLRATEPKQTPESQLGVYELPLEKWTDIGESKVRPKDFIRAIGEMAAIYRRYFLARDRGSLLALITAPFLRYAGAGAIGTAAHYLVLTLTVEVGKLSPMVGAIAGATVGAFVNYVLNYNLTFASNQPHKKTLPRFIAVALLGIVLSGLIVKFCVDGAHLHYLLAQLIGTVVVLGVGYVLNKVWTFAASRH